MPSVFTQYFHFNAFFPILFFFQSNVLMFNFRGVSIKKNIESKLFSVKLILEFKIMSVDYYLINKYPSRMNHLEHFYQFKIFTFYIFFLIASQLLPLVN